MSNKLEHYLEVWGLSDPQFLVKTPTSQIYIVTAEQDRAVLKLLNAVGIRDESKGSIALDYWNGHGVLRLLRAARDAQLLEYADGEALVSLVERGEDVQATEIVVEVINRLHSVGGDVPRKGLTPLKARFRSLFNKAKADQAAGHESVYVRGARLADALFADRRDVRVLHGDIHHYNIRHCTGRGWLAFDPKGHVGERTYDAANTLCNPDGHPELVYNEARLLNNAAILAKGIGVELDRLLAFTYAYTCLSAAWYAEDGYLEDKVLRIGRLIAPHLSGKYKGAIL